MKREPNKKLDAVEKLILMYSVELCTRKKEWKNTRPDVFDHFQGKVLSFEKGLFSLFTTKLWILWNVCWKFTLTMYFVH